MSVGNIVLVFFLLVGFLLSSIKCNNVKEQCANVCQCWYPTRDKGTIAVDCTRKIMSQPLVEWPRNVTHLVASFAHNQFKQLTRIPPSQAQTIAISFKNCSIQSIISGLFEDTVNIEYLDLSWNLLKSEDLHAAIFRGRYSDNQYEPIGLLELNLSHNRIESLEQKVFEHTPNLTVLDLSSNPLGILDNSMWFALTSLTRLARLNLNNCSLTALSDQLIMEHLPPPPIVILDLSHNKLTTVPHSLATFTDSLEQLQLDGNPIQELDDQSLLGLAKLRELRMSNMGNLRSLQHNTFTALKQLRSLHLTNNPKLSFIHSNAFGQPYNWPPIAELYINDNNLRELSPNLLNWSAVDTMRLDGNHWACHCKLPCMCGSRAQDLWTRRPETGGPSKSTRGVLIAVPVLLCFTTAVFAWRVLRRYRSYRAVNTMYPVVYTGGLAPVAHTL